jgi:hypothetical protein
VAIRAIVGKVEIPAAHRVIQVGNLRFPVAGVAAR